MNALSTFPLNKEGRLLDALPWLWPACNRAGQMNSAAIYGGCAGNPPGYCNSLVTSCCMLLACAKAEMPVCERISYFDMLEVAEA